MIDLELDKFYTIGHRGAEIGFVENSMLAFQHVSKIGIDFIELDIQETKDHILVVFHDIRLKKKMGLEGRIKDYNWIDLKEKKVKTNFGEANLITLESVLKEFQNNTMKFIFEIKSIDNLDLLVDLINQYHFEDRIIVDSFSKSKIIDFKKKCPNIFCSWLVNRWQKFSNFQALRLINLHKKYKINGFSIHQSNLTTKIQSILNEKKIFLFLWGIKKLNDYENYITMKINGFTAPDPGKLLEIIQESKK